MTSSRSRDTEQKLASSWFHDGQIVLVTVVELFQAMGVASNTLQGHIQQAKTEVALLTPSERSRYRNDFKSESGANGTRARNWFPDLAKLVSLRQVHLTSIHSAD